MTDRPGEQAGQGASPIEMEVAPLPVEAGADDAPVARPSRRRLIVLGALAVVGLAGAGVLGTAGMRISSQKDATLSPPEQVAGFRRDDSENARGTAEYLRDALAAEAQLDKTVGVIYTDPADADRSVLLSGGTALIWTPGRDLDTIFGLLKDDAGQVTGIADYPAGDLGGELRCGVTTTADDESAVCGWGDHGSLALALFPGRTAAESAPIMLQFRNAIQKRS